MNRLTVADEIGKVVETALEELRGALVMLGEDASEGQVSFVEAERRFTAAMMCFARQLLAVVLSLYDFWVGYARHQGEIWRRGKKKLPKNYFSIWGKLRVQRTGTAKAAVRS